LDKVFAYNLAARYASGSPYGSEEEAAQATNLACTVFWAHESFPGNRELTIFKVVLRQRPALSADGAAPVSDAYWLDESAGLRSEYTPRMLKG
jgi:hypothetical protein